MLIIKSQMEKPVLDNVCFRKPKKGQIIQTLLLSSKEKITGLFCACSRGFLYDLARLLHFALSAGCSRKCIYVLVT